MWEEMAGGERRRVCARCQHPVYDLSSMTEGRVRRLLVQQPKDLCVSYLIDAQGDIQFQKPAGVARGLLLGVALAVAACGDPTPPPDLRMVGSVGSPAPPPPAATTSASGEAQALPVETVALAPSAKAALKKPRRLSGAPAVTSRAPNGY
jgi:hypothetical protein